MPTSQTSDQPIIAQRGLGDRTLNDRFFALGFNDCDTAIVLIHPRGEEPSASNVSAVYYSEHDADDDCFWFQFLRHDEHWRDRYSGLHRLRGSFRVVKWKSNIEFKFVMHMQSDEPDPVTADGELVASEHDEFRPLEWMAYAAWGVGLVHPHSTAVPRAAATVRYVEPARLRDSFLIEFELLDKRVRHEISISPRGLLHSVLTQGEQVEVREGRLTNAQIADLGPALDDAANVYAPLGQTSEKLPWIKLSRGATFMTRWKDLDVKTYQNVRSLAASMPQIAR